MSNSKSSGIFEAPTCNSGLGLSDISDSLHEPVQADHSLNDQGHSLAESTPVSPSHINPRNSLDDTESTQPSQPIRDSTSQSQPEDASPNEQLLTDSPAIIASPEKDPSVVLGTEIQWWKLLSSQRYPKLVRKGVFWWWWWEIIGSILSFAFWVTAVVMLCIINGKPQANWSLKISLATLISISAKVSEVTSLFVVAEVVSQHKWRYFEREAHPLSHFQKFDDASRGAWGGFEILKTIGRKSITAALAGVIVMTALGLEPSMQAAWTTVIRPTPLMSSKGPQNPQAASLESIPASLGVAHDYVSASCGNPGNIDCVQSCILLSNHISPQAYRPT
jgi:hypothetical protein